ncbi:MAG TPA: hypothetical protein VHK06_03215 [Candidatus Limnocylindria bacterium]|nr:hypothetical protein [Candidatus Limnocylindria bacterium]
MAPEGVTRLDHVVLPRRLPRLALLERYYPSPADNLIDAELEAFASPGDTILDPWAGTGWTARRAVAHRMRSVAADPSPFAQLAALAFLRAPEAPALDAAFTQLAGARKVDVTLRQHIEELYATRCATCRRPVVADEFIWPRDADAPSRKAHRCAGCDLAVGGTPERVAPTDAQDLAKLGIDRPADESGAAREPVPLSLGADVPAASGDEPLPEAPVGLTEPVGPLAEEGDAPAQPGVGGEPGGDGGDDPPPAESGGPRFASTVRPDALSDAAPATASRLAPHYVALRERFPVLDGRDALVDEILSLYTPRNLYALEAIAAAIESEFGTAPAGAAMRLALAACLLPASRLNGYPGRVASLRIGNGHVRQPASRHQREANVWRLFEAAYRDVRTAIASGRRERRMARFAGEFGELGDMGAANVLWLRCRPGAAGQYLPDEAIDMVVGAPPRPATADELSFEYLATAWLLGRAAAETLRLEPLFGGGAPHDGVEAAALRHALAGVAPALKPGGPCTLLLEGDDPDRLLAATVAAAAAGLELVEVIHRESARSGSGYVVHLRRPGGEDRLRAAIVSGPLRLGGRQGRLTYPELADAIGRSTEALLRDRGEPAGLARIVAAVCQHLAREGLLARLAEVRGGGSEPHGSEPDGGVHRLEGGGTALLGRLLREELWRDDHPQLVRLEDDRQVAWWLREPELAEQPLADRVEWATYSILSTAGRLDEAGFLDRVYRLFPGLQAPDEELVRACLAAYARVGERGSVASEDRIADRMDDHARVVGKLVALGRRIGLRVWVSRREQQRTVDGRPLGDLLADEERRVYLPLVVRAPAEHLNAVDVIWYVRGRLSFLLEAEWTAMMGEAVLRRGRAIPPDDRQARFLVFPGERTGLVRLKLARSPWLRAEIERQNWHFLKWEHLDALLARDSVTLDALEPVLGLDPLIERGGEQLTMFGE